MAAGARHHELVLCGITTNHCCETTARMGGNLGYDVRFVLDATHTFDRGDLTAASSVWSAFSMQLAAAAGQERAVRAAPAVKNGG